ncbi:phosphatase PAP2 family protein [Vagococcus intermedius]|uniref:Phosphatase PAP2 family protein n=2 Tax=Vagococcus intermedius TaxID=2991418 RepID=A0AAF0CUL8_9ENTE|nr:phosphatase PAP2 family protein [Vagococcus intermedius]WEG73254.1 phosphatase PAP2 family protein [Vagococcus intermedius]
MILGYTVKFYEKSLSFIDVPLTALIRSTLTSSSTQFYTLITQFGSVLPLSLLTLLSSILLLYNKRRIESIWLIINAALVAGLGNYAIKYIFMRPRPDLEQLTPVTHYSFPSGHAMGSLLFYGTMIVLTQLLIKNKPIKYTIQLFLGLLILLIGISRVYLGVHFPTDIIGGYLLGLAWLLASYPFFQKKRFIWRFKSKQH